MVIFTISLLYGDAIGFLLICQYKIESYHSGSPDLSGTRSLGGN